MSVIQTEFEYLFLEHVLHYGLVEWWKKNSIDTIHSVAENAIGEEDDLYLFLKKFRTLKLIILLERKCGMKKFIRDCAGLLELVQMRIIFQHIVLEKNY